MKSSYEYINLLDVRDNVKHLKHEKYFFDGFLMDFWQELWK